MEDQVLNHLEFNRYQDLLRASFSADCLLSVWDDSENFITGTNLTSGDLAAPDFKPKEDSSWRAITDRVASSCQQGDKIWLRCSFELGPNLDRYWLIASVEKNQSTISSTQIQSYADLLDTISDCIGEDYMTSLTISDMAQELATRYEELNLIYGINTFEDIDMGDGAREEEILLKLLVSCTDYLSIDFMSIVIPDENLSIFHKAAELELQEFDETQRRLEQEVFSLARSTQETIVINKDSTTDWTDVLPDIPYKMIIAPITAATDEAVGVVVFANRTDKKNFTNSDRKLAEVLAAEASKVVRTNRDEVTGLLNRNGMRQKLADSLTRVSELGQCEAFIQIALDQFNLMNDASGFRVRDQMLQLVGSMLKTRVPESKAIGRIDADVFAVLVDWEVLEQGNLAEELRRNIAHLQFMDNENVYNTTARVAVVKIDDSFDDVASMMSAADITCQVAMELGGNQTRNYDTKDELLIRHFDLIQITGTISSALNKNAFQLFAQEIHPLDPLADSSNHYEILIRMIDKEGNLVPPEFFIPAAERYGLIHKIDLWVIRNTLEQLAEANRILGDSSLRCSINISGPSLGSDALAKFAVQEFQRNDVEPEQICFEITETTAVSNMNKALKFIDRMRELGCSFALDDFGSGMSSFGYLKELPVDYLKIDGCFVENMLSNPLDFAMVESINSIGHVMGLKTIAEYVGNAEILECLTKMKLDYGQGYGIHKPQPFFEVIDQLRVAKLNGKSSASRT